MTVQVYLSEHAQRDLDALSDKIANQILTDCGRLAEHFIPDGKRIKKLQGFKDNLYRLRTGDYRIVSSGPGPVSTLCAFSVNLISRERTD